MMYDRVLALLLCTIVAVTTAADSKEPGGPAKKWTVSFHETAFNDYDGGGVSDIPSGANGYKASETLFTPSLGLGYALNEDWSVETFLHMGPRSDFAPTVAGTEDYPRTEFKGNFASVVGSREFRLGERFRVSPKFGVAVSSLEYERQTSATDSESWTDTSVDPVASLEFERQFTDNVSLSLDFTRYFTDEKQVNNSFKFGIRFRF